MSVIPPATTSYQYNIMNGGMSSLVIPYPTVSFVPSSCNASAAYSMTINGSNISPSFISLMPQGIVVSTNDPSLSGTSYAIGLTVTPNAQNTVLPQTVSYNLAISACKIDQVQLSQSIADQIYTLSSGEMVVQSYFNSLYHCPLNYTLVSNMPSGTPVQISLNQNTGSLKFNATSNSLDGQEFQFDLKATSVLSNDYFIDSFKVKFLNICNTVSMTAAAFADSEVSQ